MHKAILILIIAGMVTSSSIIYAPTLSWEFYNDILVSNVDVSSHKKEAHIMRHPTDNNRLLAAFIDYASTPERCRVATSSDGGASWSVTSYLPLPSSTSKSVDPVIAVRSTSTGTTWYVTCFALTDSSYSIGDYSKIYYATSTDNGSTWASTIVVREAYCSSSTNCPIVDKPWIAVYGSNVYVCYAYMDNFIAWNNGNQSTIRIFVNSKEITSGTSWKANNGVSDRSVQGCNIAVNSNGVVYVVWARLTSDTQGRIELSRSFDNGNTFESPKTVATFTRTPTTAGNNCVDAFGCVIGVIANGKQSGFRAPSFPYIAIDGQNNIHIVFQDYSSSTLTDIKYTKSTNCKTQQGSCTFTTPVRILNDNNVSKDQFMPSITFSGKTNTIHVTALDRRDSLANTGWRPTHYHCHLDVNTCTQESHWSTSSIGAQSSNLDGSNFIGDYYSVTSNGSREAYAVWIDTKTVNAEWKYRIWFDRTTT